MTCHFFCFVGQLYGLLRSRQNDGYLEIHNIGWQSICGNSWTKLNTNVACFHMGFGRERAKVEKINGHELKLSNKTMSQFMYDIHCDGSELSLLDCQWTGFEQIVQHCSLIYLTCAPGP